MLIKYDFIGAYKARVVLSPIEDIEGLGMLIISYSAFPLDDCAIVEVENAPKVLPKYIQIKTQTTKI